MALTSSLAFSVALAALRLSSYAQARPAPSPSPFALFPRQDDAIVPLATSDVASFKPYTWYASAAHCTAAATINWTCGTSCDANPTFKPVDSGGDGVNTQYWYVGYDPTLNQVIVGHQGTDFSKVVPGLIDFDTTPVALDSDLFPGINSSVLVHQGFSGTQSRSAPGVLSAVNKALSLYPTRDVTVVGHSLGAAIALLDAVYLPLHLPSDVTVRYVGYASPRVGNQAFADYVDSLPISFRRVNNKNDVVPIVPPIAVFGYHHPSGEVHIRDDNVWVSCPGQDNPSDECATGAATLMSFNSSQHGGPYDGVIMGTGC